MDQHRHPGDPEVAVEPTERIATWIASAAAGSAVLAFILRPLIKMGAIEVRVDGTEHRVSALEDSKSACHETNTAVKVLGQKLDDHIEREEGSLQAIIDKLNEGDRR